MTADPRVEAVAEALRSCYRADEPFTPAALAPIAVAALDAYDAPKFTSVVHECCERAEKAEAAIARVRALCDAHEYGARDWDIAVVPTSLLRAAVDGEFVCGAPVDRVCDECRDKDGERIGYPCPTIRALDRVAPMRAWGIDPGEVE